MRLQRQQRDATSLFTAGHRHSITAHCLHTSAPICIASLKVFAPVGRIMNSCSSKNKSTTRRDQFVSHVSKCIHSNSETNTAECQCHYNTY
eukprot:18795-Heterococcus_DN1.PRE.1